MKKIILILIALTFLISKDVSAGKGIAGKWSSDKRSPDGNGSMLIFTADKKVKLAVGPLVDFNYSVEKDTIVFVFTNSDSAKTKSVNKVAYKFISDTLYLYPKDTASIQKLFCINKIKSKKNKFAGTWSFKHSSGKKATWQFTDKGFAQLSVPFKVWEGTYLLKNNKLTINAAGKPMEHPTVKLKGDHLTLANTEKNTEDHYTRVNP
jgi:hypothetical protein